MEAAIKISKDKILITLLFLMLFFFNSKSGIELKFLIALILGAILFLGKLKLYNSLLITVFPLVIILSIGFLSALIYFPHPYDFIKDLVHISTPIFGIFFGFYLTKNLNDKSQIFKMIILYCFLSAIIHIVTIFINVDGEWSTSYIRNIGGKGSDMEAFGYSLFIAFLRKKEYRVFSKRFNRLYFIVATLSILLYLSRTTFIAVLLFLISYYGLTQLNRKQIIYLFGVFTASIFFMVSLQFMDIKRGATGIESFLYKIKIAPQEIFNSDINVDDHTQLWDKWRAYEVKMALNTMDEKESIVPYATGLGLGSLVNLGFEAPLGAKRMQYIPHLHNGYAYVFFKSGLVGLMVMLVWIVYMYGYIYKSSPTFEKKMFRRIISGFGLYLFFSTLVITGIYNLGVILSVLIGLILGLISYNGDVFSKVEK